MNMEINTGGRIRRRQSFDQRQLLAAALKAEAR